MSENDFISQLNFSYFKGRITDVIPLSVDSNTGNIYEQEIIFQLENGMPITLSDNDLHCKKENIGQEKCIKMANAFRVSLEKCGNNNLKKGIFPSPSDQVHSPMICGIIKKIFEPSEEKKRFSRRYAILDIGIGQIMIVIWKDHKEDFTIFHEGDCIFIKSGRLDLLSIC